MAGKDRRWNWKRNCQRMYDRAEHSDSWVVTPACRSQSSFSRCDELCVFWSWFFFFFFFFWKRGLPYLSKVGQLF